MKRLKLFNNLTRQKEDFIPLLEEGKKDFVGIYSCGPTVYDNPHFGNLRAMFTADLIRNVIRNVIGYPTKMVSNFTDVGHMVGDGDCGEDKMEKGSRKSGMSARDLAKYYENIFRDYAKKMNIENFDEQPRATDYIKEQLEMVQILVDKGYTYEIPGDGIYFDTSKVEDYGKLLGPNYKKHLEGINAGERIDCEGKRNPTDFALWKFSPKDQQRQMEWDSPWGKSFPGWHIECSAMSRVFLGDQFDIHHGGYDLIPVHHTNEIIQSECAYDVHPWVKYWIHNQFVNMNGEKMSKSTGNFIAPQEILEKGYTFMDLRYFFLQVHYRSFADFTWDSIQAAKNARINFLKKLLNLIKELNFDLSQIDKIYSEKINYEKFGEKYISLEQTQKIFDEMIDNILDDFNTPALISNINTALNIKNEDVLKVIFYFDKVLLRLDLYKEIVFMLNKEELESNVEIPLDIQDLAKARQEAKSNKNYSLADELRNKVESMGYKIVDNQDGYQIKKI